MPVPVKIGDVCKRGHVIAGDNAIIRKNNSGAEVWRCRTCYSEHAKRWRKSEKGERYEKKRMEKQRQRRRETGYHKMKWAQMTDEQKREKNAEARAARRGISLDELLKLEAHIKAEYDRLFEEEIIALPNHLFLNEEQRAADDEFADAVKQHGAPKCFNNWTEYVDAFFDEEDKAIVPSSDRVDELCGECPIAQACLKRAVTMRPAGGVWGGHGWVDGRIVV